MLSKFRHYIEETDWDEQLFESEKYLDIFCVAVMIFAVLYFGAGILVAFWRG